MRVVVDNRLRISLAELSDDLVRSLKSECEHKNPTRKIRGRRKPGEPDYYRTWGMTKTELSLPRGATFAVRDVCSRYGLDEPDWVDDRITGELPPPNCTHRIDPLWQHQVEVIDAIFRKENCLIVSPTGSGKTTAAIGFIAKANLPTIVIVWSDRLLDQWVERLQAELGMREADIGVLCGSKKTIGPITVAMQQTLYANPELTKSLAGKFGVAIFDEVQRFAARTFMDVVDWFPAKYRVGISADHTRKDRKEFLIHDQFGLVAAEISKAELIKRGCILDVETRIIPTDFKAQWYVDQSNNPRQMPDFKRLLDELCADRKRNDLIMRYARTSMAFGQQVLIFTHRREHAVALVAAEVANGSQCGIMLGGTTGRREFREAVKGIRSRQMNMAAGTYQAIGQAIDLPALDCGIAATPIHTNKQAWGQVKGRLCRVTTGKSRAVIYYLWDRYVFGIEPIMKLKVRSNVTVRTDDGKWLSAKDYLKHLEDQRRRYRQPGGQQHGTAARSK